MTANQLTQKDEQACLNIVSGMNATDALRSAGFALTSTYHTTRWLNRVNIKSRLAELRAPAVKRAKASKDYKLSVLENIYTAEPLPQEITVRDRLTAIAEHSKLLGDYAPAKSDHTFNGEGLSEVLLKLRGYSTPRLDGSRKLLETASEGLEPGESETSSLSDERECP
jgi:phage terminase small subunit